GPLEAWLHRRDQTLLEEVMAIWQENLGRSGPDEDLLARLAEALPVGLPMGAPDDSERQLGAALDLLEGATSQSDLLRRLLDGLAPLVERSALFILKQGLASLYAQRGFDGEAGRHPGAIVPPPDLEALIQGGGLIRKGGPAYRALLGALGPLEASDLAILPLRHKRKTVALLLVDSGLRKALDHPEQVRALVLATSALLAALAAGREEEHSAPAIAPHPNAPTQVVPDPLESRRETELDPRTRANAERLARVLVGDVELYFPAKVAQARSQGNLYGNLRDELERSRTTFVERFGEDVELQHRIFTTTVIQQLCDGDPGKLGAAPWA
ncbi:MAG TPA: hypothetical protein VF768_12165, partial [Holophagaceae bacterium]